MLPRGAFAVDGVDEGGASGVRCHHVRVYQRGGAWDSVRCFAGMGVKDISSLDCHKPDQEPVSDCDLRWRVPHGEALTQKTLSLHLTK